MNIQKYRNNKSIFFIVVRATNTLAKVVFVAILSATPATFTRCLNGRAWQCGVGAKHAGIASFGLQHNLALLTFIKPLAGVSWHGFGLYKAALWAG